MISIVRTIIIFAALMLAMRLMGKRQLGELQPSELAVAVLISNMASHPLQDMGIPLINGLTPVFTLLCCELILSGLCMKHGRLRAVVYGKPDVLIWNGKINQPEMSRNRITLEELYEELRSQGFERIDQIQFGIVETSGTLSLLPKPEEKPVTAGQMGLPPEKPSYPVMVINNGRILDGNLRFLGKERKWLEAQLKKQKISSASSVYVMTADENGCLEVQTKEKA